MLRKFIENRWSPALPRWKGSGISILAKDQIRPIVFQGLSDSQSKIRSLCAQIVSTIANADWPDEWPDLLNTLIGLLSSDSPPSVHGAMQVLAELIKTDLTEDQILPVLRQLLPILLNVLGAIEHPQAVKEAAATVIPPWLDAFKYLLELDPRQDVENRPNWDGIALRIQIYKALDAVHAPFARVLQPYINNFLASSLNHLLLLFPTFVHFYVLAQEPIPTPSENEPTELSQLFSSIMDLISVLTRGGKGKEWLNGDNTKALLIAVLNWIQITQDEEEEWAGNANAFVANEAEDSFAFSLRVAGLDMLGALVDGFRPIAMAALQRSIQEVTSLSDQARSIGNPDWWRLLEAMLTALGSQAESVLEWIDDEVDSGRPNPIDIQALLTNVIPNLLGLSDCPFLQGRAFVFASQFTKVLPTQLAGEYLHATVQVLEASEANVPIKVSAVRAVHNFCKEIDGQLLVSVAPRIAKAVGPFLSVTSDDTLSLVLEALSVIVEIDDGKWMTTDLADSLVGAVLDVWMRNNKDPLFISVLTEILDSLASSSAPDVYETVVRRALPALSNAITASTEKEHWITGAAIDLASSLARGAPETGLGEGFVGLLSPGLFLALRTIEDRDVIQNGILCLTLIIRKDFGQLQSWTDPTTGQAGLDSVLAVIAKQMRSQDESGGLAMGDMIIHLFRKAGEAVVPILPDLLQAMLGRMISAKTATFIQSLVIPFAFLLHNQRDTVLSLLESISVDSRSGLDILIQTWCENEETFQGFWAQRISTLALSSLYASGRPSLQSIVVKGDLIIKPETQNVIMTRSKTKTAGRVLVPTEFTSLPFPVKAVKMLLSELQSGGEAASKRLGRMSDLESDDGDSDWAEDEPEGSQMKPGGLRDDEFAVLSEYLTPGGLPFDFDDALEPPDDEDLKNDPVCQIDLRDHLLAFFRECAAHNINDFSAIVEQLSAEEIVVIREVVNS
ncbi:uncharacterized protein FIBRA_00538 [Fibroporia radiculosa]|uniref:Importin-9 central HEAT repeats domain-containing protein n=1 Tax=Fibroporia radiculosa TaxID=599839 RepID=J4H068_9APHY|nr:uncharacterized protein FIBRA_00538 [Fibroporia radiculosa]CCL98539.1 predicted protein [Fibroporia radiculosa]